MSSNGGNKTRGKENGGMVRRSLRSLSFRSTTKGRKKHSNSHDSADGQNSKPTYRHSVGELTNNNNGATKPPFICSGIAVLPFTGILHCDLTFKAGDRIDILTQTDKWYDWWEGRVHGRTGIFPANYVKIVD